MRATFDHSQDEASHITTFFFKPERPLRYTAGQYIELTLAHAQPDKRGAKRWFTLSSAPGQDLVSITTKFAVTGGSTFKNALHDLIPGTEVLMSDPMGDFVLPKLIQTPLIFVAGGIGVTPFHSMLSWLVDTGEKRPIKFVYGVKTEDEIAFQPTFDKADQHVTIVVSDPTSAWGGQRGELNAELILGLEKPSPDTLMYLSGPEPMIESLQNDLRRRDIADDHIIGDFFPGYLTT